MTRATRRSRSRRERIPAAALALTAVAGCSLAIGDFDECRADADCIDRGPGLVCVDALCVLASGVPDAGTGGEGACKSDQQCQDDEGYGVVCQPEGCKVADKDEHCTESEPPDLLDRLGTEPIDDLLLLGAIFKLATPKEAARADAVRLAVREMNESGGVVGVPVGVILCDNDVDGSAANDPQETEALTRYLAGTLGVKLVIGPSSSANATVATNTLLTQHMPSAVISPSATSGTLTNLVDRFDPATDPFGLFWRTCPSDTLQSQVLADTIGATPVTHVAVLYQRDPYGQGLEETFRTAFLALGSDNAVASHSFEIDESDIPEAVAAVAQGGQEALLLVSGDAARTLHVLEQVVGAPLLASLPLFLTDGSKDAAILLDPGVPAEVRAMLKAATGTAPARPSGVAYDTFANNLTAEFGVDPAGFSFVAQAYDAAYVGVLGLAWATGLGTTYDGFDVAAGLARLNEGDAVNLGPTGFTTGVAMLRMHSTIDVEGTSGPLDFDASLGEAPGPIEIWRVNAAGDGFETVTVVNP